MRNLTDDEVAAEVAKIEDENQWPNWPWLPMKQINRHSGDYSDENDGLGMLLSPSSTQGAGQPIRLLLTNMFNLRAALEDLNTKHLNFESVEAMVRAGWIGD